MAEVRSERAAPTPQPALRRLNPRRDLDAVLDFQYEVYESNFPGFRVGRHFRDSYGQDLRRAARSPDEAMFVLDQDGHVCGFAWGALMSTLVDARVGYIKNVYVAPHLRGTEQAARLLAAVEYWLYEQGADKIVLDASVCNGRAVSFYEKTGYVIEPVRMVKRLVPTDDLRGLS